MADLAALAALAASRGGGPPSSGPVLSPFPRGPQGGTGDVQAMLARLQQVRAQRPALDLTVAHKAAPQHKGKSRGLLTQLRDAVVSLPKGVIHLAGQGISEATHLGSGKTGVLGALRLASGNLSDQQYEAANPLSGEAAHSMQHTLADVRHPTRFAQAVRQGTIVDKLLEDTANASLIAGGAGMAARAAGAAGLAGGLERVAALGGEVANAPISVPRAALTGLTERGMPALGRLPVGAFDEALQRRRTLGENFPTSFTSHGREAMKLTKAEVRAANRDAAAQVRTGYRESTAREKLGGNPTPAEEAAANAIVSGQADVARVALERGADPATVQRAVAPQNVPESHLTPEAFQIAQDFLVDPAMHPRVQRLVELYGKTSEKFTRQAVEGYGRRTALEPEQISSHDVLPRVRDQFEATWDKQIEDARKFDPRIVSDLLAEKDQAWQGVLDDPMSYPARWRDRMIEAQQLAAAQGENRPSYKIARQSDLPLDESMGRPSGAYFYVNEPGASASWAGNHEMTVSPTRPLEVQRGGMESSAQAAIRQLNPELAGALDDALMTAGDSVSSAQVRHALDIARQAGVDLAPATVDYLLNQSENYWDVYDAIGGEMARRAGHDAIIGRTGIEAAQARNYGDLSEYVALSQPALTPPRAPFPTRPPELAAQGILPEYLPSGRSRLTRPKASKLEMQAANEGVMGDIRLTSEKTKGTRGHFGLFSNRTLFDRWGEEARQGRLNEMYRTLTDTEGRFATSPAKVLGPDVLDQINQDAVTEAQRRFPNGGDIAAEADRLRGDAIRNAMRDQGFEAWATEGSATGQIPAQSIRADSPFLHAGMKAKLSQQWTLKEPPLPLKAMEAINKKFKGAVLPWSIRWQVGDAMSNALLSWVAGDVNPVELAASMRRLKRLTPEETALLDAHVQDAGLTFQEREWQHNLPSKENARFREHPIKALQRPGYRLNSAINRTQRHGFYLEKLDRLLADQGITLQEAGRQVEAGVESPKITAAIDKAVQEANDVLGAFDELSPFERRYMRNLFPFYPWMRHITTLSARLAIDNPVRAMWIMRVGSIGADPNSELPGYLRGAIHTPVGTFDTNFLNPFADATGQSPLTPEGAMRALSPAIKVGAAVATGADLNRGTLQLSRPFNTSRRDDFGRQSFNPLGLPNRWDELGYLLTQQIPQTRLAVNLAPQVKVGDVTLGPVARYAQGSMLKRGQSEAPLDTDPRSQELARLVSIPIPQSDKDIAQMLRSIRRRKG